MNGYHLFKIKNFYFHDTNSYLKNDHNSLSNKNPNPQLNKQFNFSFYQTVTIFSWPPLSVDPKDLLNKGPEVTIFGLKSKANLECAVDQLAKRLENLNLPTVIVFGPRFNSYRVCDALKNSQIKDQVSLRWINKITAFKAKKNTLHYEQKPYDHTQLLNKFFFLTE